MSNQNGFESDEQEAYEYAKWQEQQVAKEPNVVPCFECGNPMYEFSEHPQLNICDSCGEQMRVIEERF